MIDSLSDLVPAFAGPTNQTRCFLHVVNLIAKSLLRQFDTAKTDLNGSGELEDEELNETGDGDGDGDGVEDEGDDDDDETDNDEGWVDESKELSARDLEELKRTTRPVKAALLKVRTSHKTAYLRI